jgi:hypothetical protein
MIKKYQIKNESTYHTKPGHILPEILTKSDKKLASGASANRDRIAQLARSS